MADLIPLNDIEQLASIYELVLNTRNECKILVFIFNSIFLIEMWMILTDTWVVCRKTRSMAPLWGRHSAAFWRSSLGTWRRETDSSMKTAQVPHRLLQVKNAVLVFGWICFNSTVFNFRSIKRNQQSKPFQFDLQ